MNARLLHILADSFPKILIPGLTVTIPLTAIAVVGLIDLAVFSPCVSPFCCSWPDAPARSPSAGS